MDDLDRVADLIASKSSVLLTSHIRLDGDAVGSELALADGLAQLGKKAHIVNDGPVPGLYTYMNGTHEIGASVRELRGDYDLVIVLDSSDRERLGGISNALPQGTPVLNIDHHSSNDSFGEVAWVDVHASSVGEMIYRLLRRLGAEITPNIAIGLYTAIATDTGRFLHSNTSPEALKITAELLGCGLDLTKANNALYRCTSFNLLKLRMLAEETIALHAGGKIASMHMTKRMFAETGTSPLDTQEFVEIPRSIEGVSVAVLLYELKKPNQVKVSFRSNEDVDVCAVAKQFGGGGHVRAAGCEIDLPLNRAERRVIQAVEAALCPSCHGATP
ncbi:MAG: bifunctional oligoribonuclease/PAP phosphatase NrnA [Planctomycetes bacterium]|nr:bifunctional oligoribonuclease/PAP phosphatase NrnA [Planctomycetota bacterium]